VKYLQPLDLVLFNKTKEAYGAHVGVYLGKDKIIHLLKEVGYPTVWDFKDFRKRENYKVFVGAKRMNNSLIKPPYRFKVRQSSPHLGLRTNGYENL
jgi:cell wall-associated NlpC family hydrolase